ncbi:MAG: DUF4937 domain-containing protein [Phycisphaerales bacterium]
MVLKDFRCRVGDQHRDQFSAEQMRWGALRAEPGFVAQCGGHELGDSSLVQIFGVWDDLEAYRAFMGGAHDRIFEAGEQGACYHDGESLVYQRVLDMPGIAQDLASAINFGTALIRIARCDVLPDRVDHFIEMQESVWKPGMSQAAGMLGGSLWRSVDDEHGFIVTTAWASVQDHERYRAERLDGLRAQAQPGDDLVSIGGSAVVLEPAWTAVREGK